MKQGWLILLLACAMAAAMVPRIRRSQPTEKAPLICAPTTACSWSIYNPVTRSVVMNISNTYCICSPDTICNFFEDDSTVNTLVYRCTKPKDS